jgi:FKBP-type peptidyl-prolyl cis-trans isomerase FklB
LKFKLLNHVKEKSMTFWIMRVFWLILLALSQPTVAADEGSLIQTDQQMFSYTLGYQIGGQLAVQIRDGGLDLDPDAFAQAIADVLSGRPSAMTAVQMEAALEMLEQQQNIRQNTAAETGQSRGEAFQTEYSERQGVVVTSSGLQYRVIETGEGRSPGSADTVVVHYVGQLIDGTEFDSSRRRGTPATFSLGGIIPGWQEVLQLMHEGDIWEVVIPSELAYGARGAGESIGPNETLVFEIELISVK